MTPRTDLSYRPLQSRLHQILDASDLTECALSEVHISALAHHPDEHYLPTLKRLLKIWAELQTRLGHDNTSALRREIANKIAKSLKADHLTRAVTAYVEYAPRATTADLDTITVLVQNLMEPGEADMAELEHGDLPPNPYYLNPVVLTRVSFMIYQGVKAAKTVGGSPNKGRSLADPVTPVGPMSRSVPNMSPDEPATGSATPVFAPRKRSLPLPLSSASLPLDVSHPNKRSRKGSTTQSPSLLPSNTPPPSFQPTPPSASPRVYPRNTATYRNDTIQREGKRCLITSRYPGTDHLQIAHIIPYSLLNNNEAYNKNPFWKFLRCWLGEHRSWKIWSAVGTEATKGGGVLFNLMCVLRDVHALWDTGEVIIVPEVLEENVEEEVKEESVEGGEVGAAEEGYAADAALKHRQREDLVFLMPVRYTHIDSNGRSVIGPLPKSRYQREFPMSLDPPFDPSAPLHAVVTICDETNVPIKRLCDDHRRIKNGETIVLYNHMRDNERYPLPHPDLLRLWGSLSRVMRMSGMGEVVDLERQWEQDGCAVGWMEDIANEEGWEYFARKLEGLKVVRWNEGEDGGEGALDDAAIAEPEEEHKAESAGFDVSRKFTRTAVPLQHRPHGYHVVDYQTDRFSSSPSYPGGDPVLQLPFSSPPTSPLSHGNVKLTRHPVGNGCKSQMTGGNTPPVVPPSALGKRGPSIHPGEKGTRRKRPRNGYRNS